MIIDRNSADQGVFTEVQATPTGTNENTVEDQSLEQLTHSEKIFEKGNSSSNSQKESLSDSSSNNADKASKPDSAGAAPLETFIEQYNLDTRRLEMAKEILTEL